MTEKLLKAMLNQNKQTLSRHVPVKFWQIKSLWVSLLSTSRSCASSRGTCCSVEAPPVSILLSIPWRRKKKDEPQHDKTNKWNVRPAKTWISLGIRPVWSESSLSAWRKLGSLTTHLAYREDWSDWADAQADLSCRWAHMPLCWFCHEVAQTVYRNIWKIRTPGQIAVIILKLNNVVLP